jgi:hypothetical protein
VALHWPIDHQARLVSATVQGSVTAADIKDYLDRIAADNAMPYAKLFDISNTDATLTVEDLQSLGRSIRQ